MTVQNPSFEDGVAGENAGIADDWTFNDSLALGFSYAAYSRTTGGGIDYWGAEYFEGGWNNDDGFYDSLTTTGVTWFALGEEGFEGWPGFAMTWTTSWAEATAEYAEYSTVAGAVEYEGFESEWDNDLRPDGAHLFMFRPWEVGTQPTYLDPGTNSYSFVIGTTFNKVRLRLWDGTDDFDAILTIPAGTYTVAQMVVQLNALTDAALVAQGIPFVAGDVGWVVDEAGGLRVEGAKATFFFFPLGVSSGSAWSTLGFDLTLRSVPTSHPVEADVLTLALYTLGALAYEFFEIMWDNDFADIIWVGVDWVDGDKADPTTFTITGSVNDQIHIWLDDFAGTAVLLICTIAPGSYDFAGMRAALNTAIDNALTAAGAPWGPGNIDVYASPAGQLRITNQAGVVGAGANMFFAEPNTRSAWSEMGFTLLPTYQDVDRHSRRSEEFVLWTYALYDVGVNAWENFEDPGWTPIP